MRQVPPVAGAPAHHLVIGSGKISRHFAKYFSDLSLSFETWCTPRHFTPDFFQSFRATHVWLLVSDRAIEEVATRVRTGLVERESEREPRLLHASGATLVPGVLGAHPLMTFGDILYSEESYRRIPFVIENPFNGETVEDLLGGLPNVAVFLDPANRSLYHSLVSVAGNFPALLWTEVFSRFEKDLGLPREILAPFLFQTLTNVLQSGEAALTGPLVRGDLPTVKNHRAVLEGSSLSPIYGAFEDFFRRRGEPHV